MNLKQLSDCCSLLTSTFLSQSGQKHINRKDYIKYFKVTNITQSTKGNYQITIICDQLDKLLNGQPKTIGEVLQEQSGMESYVAKLDPSVANIILQQDRFLVNLTEQEVAASAGMTDAKDILPAEILQSFSRGFQGGYDFVVATISSLKDVDTKFKTDPYGLIITPSGTPMYMKPVDNRKFVQDGYRQSLDEDGAIIRKEDFVNNIILTDATNSRLVVSNTDGYIVGQDFRGYRKFDINCAILVLESTFVDQKTCGDLYNEVLQAISNSSFEINKWGQWFQHLYTNPTVEMTKIEEKLEDYWKQCVKKTQEELNLSYYQYLVDYMPKFLCLLNYGKQLGPEFSRRYKVKMNKSNVELKLPNLDGVSGLMPHQQDVLKSSTQNKINIINVATGGGKSIMTISDIAIKLKEGKIKKPLILMPTKLIGQYVSEIYRFSDNKLNSFVYSTETIRDYKVAYGNDTTAITKQDKNMPANTIYLCGYNLLKAQNSWDGKAQDSFYLGQKQLSFPIAEYLSKQGFDAVYMDEAHKLKNINGRLTKIVQSMLSGIENITLMSGTLVYNNIDDMNAILALAKPETQMLTANQNPNYNEVMNACDINFVAKQEKDWAAFLPQFKDYLYGVDLPDELKNAYHDAEDEVFTQILNDPTMAKYKKALEGQTVQLSDEDEEDMEDAIAAQMQLRFQKLETIVNAPDTIGYNAISPKVKAFDDIVDAHEAHTTLQGIDFTKSKGKIFAFGLNKNVSAEIAKYSKHKNIMAHYSAGDKAAINEFLTNPKIRILVADITSIAEGWNFQIADTCICCQNVFAGGQYQQAIARVFRPKVGDISRPVVNNITIAANNTVDMVKFARLLWKKIQTSKLYNSGDPSYRALAQENNLDDLPKLSLSIKSIVENEDWDVLNKLGYGKAISAVNTWNAQTLTKSKEMLIRDAAVRLHKKPEDIDLKTDMLIPVEHDEEIKGSKTVWTAKPNGFSVGDVLSLEQVITNLLANYTGEQTDKQYIRSQLTGKKVLTAFGEGVIFDPAVHKVWPSSTITISGQNIRLSNSECLYIEDASPDTIEKLKAKFTSKPVQAVIPVSEVIVNEDEEEVPFDENPEQDEATYLDLNVGVVNNQAAVIDFNGYSLPSFKELGPVLYAKVTTRKGFQNLQAFMETVKSLDFDGDFVEELEKARNRFIKPQLGYATETSKFARLNPWIVKERKLSKDGTISPFTGYIGDEVFVFVPIRQSPKARKLINKKVCIGVSRFEKIQHFQVRFCKDRSIINQVLDKLNDKFGVQDLTILKDTAKLIKTKGKI